MIVVISAEAERDLEAIGDYIARDNPQRAISFVREIREQCVQLAEMPAAAPLVSRYQRYGVRRHVHGNYLIFYQFDSERLVVLHILHGAMEYEPILFPS
jgi:plasmid stabilization system protein ParE